MKSKPTNKVSSKPSAEAEVLTKMSDRQIDTTDIPEITDFSGAQRGKFFRPVKQQISLRIDADIIAWFKDHASKDQGYQTEMNQALREYTEAKDRKRA